MPTTGPCSVEAGMSVAASSWAQTRGERKKKHTNKSDNRSIVLPHTAWEGTEKKQTGRLSTKDQKKVE